MSFPAVNYLAVLVAAFAIWILGALWYSKALFAKRWMALMGKSEADLKASAAEGSPMPILLGLAFACSLASAWALAVLLNHFPPVTLLRAALLGLLCWLGFAAPTSFATAMFSQQPKGLWLINSGYNAVSFVIAALILAVWR